MKIIAFAVLFFLVACCPKITPGPSTTITTIDTTKTAAAPPAPAVIEKDSSEIYLNILNICDQVWRENHPVINFGAAKDSTVQVPFSRDTKPKKIKTSGGTLQVTDSGIVFKSRCNELQVAYDSLYTLYITKDNQTTQPFYIEKCDFGPKWIHYLFIFLFVTVIILYIFKK